MNLMSNSGKRNLTRSSTRSEAAAAVVRLRLKGLKIIVLRFIEPIFFFVVVFVTVAQCAGWDVRPLHVLDLFLLFLGNRETGSSLFAASMKRCSVGKIDCRQQRFTRPNGSLFACCGIAFELRIMQESLHENPPGPHSASSNAIHGNTYYRCPARESFLESFEPQ